MNDSLLICYYFFLDKKVTKNQDSGDASFAAQAFAHNHLKPRAARICRWYHTYPNASGKSALPLQPHTPSIVLPDSSRSRSAVGKKEEKIIIKTLSSLHCHALLAMKLVSTGLSKKRASAGGNARWNFGCAGSFSGRTGGSFF